jgi:ABC-2 type transport system ATP-binding protein
MSVGELGDFTASFHRPGFRDRFVGMLGRFRLERDARLRTLSKGGYARVGLAVALAADPEVLILDEPTSGLDLFTRREFLDSMVELAAQGRTILISSHAIAELERVASHVAFLAEGRLLLAGAMDELQRRLIKVRIRHDGSISPGSGLGNVIDLESSGKEWQAVLLDPDRGALDGLRARPGVMNMYEQPLSLEQAYLALLARSHRRQGDRMDRDHRIPVAQVAEDRP